MFNAWRCTSEWSLFDRHSFPKQMSCWQLALATGRLGANPHPAKYHRWFNVANAKPGWIWCIAAAHQILIYCGFSFPSQLVAPSSRLSLIFAVLMSRPILANSNPQPPNCHILLFSGQLLSRHLRKVNFQLFRCTSLSLFLLTLCLLIFWVTFAFAL